jgi:hypothetical protein
VPKRLTNRRGVALIEIMFGLIFISVSVVGLYTMYFSGLRIFDEQRHRRLVLERAQQKMERVKFMQNYYKTIPLTEARRGIDTIVVSDADGLAVIMPEYNVTLIPSQQLNSLGQPAYYEVSVVYSWVEELGETGRRPYEISLKSAF